MIQLSAHCRLGRDPHEIPTRTGTLMVVASAAADIPIEQSDGEAETLWLNLVAFNRTAEELLRHQKGDLLNVLGQLTARRWTDRQSGETRQSWQLTVEALVSARTTRPRGGKRSRLPASRLQASHLQASSEPQPQRQAARQEATEAFYDDPEIPF